MRDFNQQMNEARIAKMSHVVGQTSTLSPYMLFPIRLETHFRTKKVSTKPIHEIEIEAVIRDFINVFDSIKEIDVQNEKQQSALTESLYDLGTKIIELDLLSSEDKETVVKLAKSLHKVFKTLNKEDGFSNLSQHIEYILKVSKKIETSSSLKRNDGTSFIKDLEKEFNSLSTIIEYTKTPYRSTKFFESINENLRYQSTKEENRILYQYIESRLVRLRTFFKEANTRFDKIPTLDKKQRNLLKNKYKVNNNSFWQRRIGQVQINLEKIYKNLSNQRDKLTGKYSDEWQSIIIDIEKAYLNFAKDIDTRIHKIAFKVSFYTNVAQRIISLQMDIWIATSLLKPIPLELLLKKTASIKNQVSILHIAYETEESMIRELLESYNKSVRAYYKEMANAQYVEYKKNNETVNRLVINPSFKNLADVRKERIINENQLCIRIFPDEIFIHQHDILLTKQEYDDAIYFWLSWFIASGNTKYEKEAWNRLCAKYEVMRASWITRKLRPINLKNYLQYQPFRNNQKLEELAAQLIDEMNQFELIDDDKSNTQEVNENALIATINRIRPIFYKLRGHSMRHTEIVDFYFQNIEQSLKYLQRRLASLIRFYDQNPIYKEPPYMAFRDPDFAALSTFYKEVKDLILHLKDHHISLDQMIEEYKEKYLKDDQFFPSITKFREENDYMAPISNIMPDRFLFIGTSPIKYNKIREEQIIYAGRKVKENLQLGFNPFENPDINPYNLNMQTGEVDVRGGIKWMVDYEAAVKSGMAITVPLPHDDNNYEHVSFTSIYVLGIKDKTDKRSLNDFFTGHIYGQTGLDFLNIGTPTNSIDGIVSSYTSDEELLKERRFEIEIEEKFKENSDALFDAASFLFGMDKPHFHETLARTNSFDNKEIEKAKVINKKLHKKLKSSFKMNGSTDFINKSSKFLQQIPYFVSNYALARGIFPPFRIGKQPYGLMPTTAFSQFRLESKGDSLIKSNMQRLYNKNQTSGPFKNYREEQEFLNFARQLYPLLKEVTSLWTMIKNKEVIHSQNLNNTEEDNINDRFTEMASATPTMVSFFLRTLTPNLNPNKSYVGLKNDSLNLAKVIQSIFDLDEDRAYIESEIKSELLAWDIIENSRVIIVDKQASEDPESEEHTLEYFIENYLNIEAPDDLSEEEFHLLVIEFMDLFTYRLDAWWLGLVNYQLSRVRQGHFGKEKEAIQIGAFGWIFDLKKGSKTSISPNEQQRLAKDLKLPDVDLPIFCDNDHNEFLIAPSINHAAAAAVLRSNYLKEQNDLQGKSSQRHCISLSSLRVRQALRLMEGVRNGLSLGAILGADLERAIHESYKVDNLELNRYIYLLREEFPLKMQTIGHGENKDDNYQMTLINAELLLDSFMDDFEKQSNSKYIADYLINDANERKVAWFNKLFKARSADGHKERLARLIEQIADAYDAVGDLILSEGVYQLVKGNRVAFSAWMKNLEHGNFSTEPEFVEIPMHSAMVEHKTAMLFSDDRSIDTLEGWNRNSFKSINGGLIDIKEREWLLAQLEPALHKYVAEQLGLAKNICFAVDIRENEESHTKIICSMEDLAVSPLELLFLSANERLLSTYLEWLLRQKYDWYQDKLTLDLRAEIPNAKDGQKSLYSYKLQWDNLRSLISKTRPLNASDFSYDTRENESIVASSFNLDELLTRYNLLHSYYESLLIELMALINKTNRVLTNDNLRDKYLEEFIEVIINVSSLGTTYSLSSLSPEIFHMKMKEEEKEQQLVQIQEHLTELHHLLSNKVREAEQKMSENDKSDEDSYVLTLQEAVKELTNSHFKLIPMFTLESLLDSEKEMIKTQLMPEFQYLNTSSLDMERWLAELSKVRNSMKELYEIRMFSEFNDGINKELRALQFPYDSEMDSEWLGRELSSEEKIVDKNSLVLLNAEALQLSHSVEFSGILVDQWMELIPYKNQEGGLVFQFDQPDAEAPQTILLALPAQINIRNKKGSFKAKNWTLNDIILTLKDTKELAENRAVEPQHIERNEALSRILPLLKFQAK